MLEIISSIAIFLFVLSFLVIIHELGHFLTAKFFGVRVDEFGLGYPPKAKKLFTWLNTEFTLNWLPIGGFVRLWGEEREDMHQHSGEKSDMFSAKPAWQRVVILAAGAFVNFVFGILAFAIIYTWVGIPEPRSLESGIMVTSLTPNSPAQNSGIVPEDVITTITFDQESVQVNNVETFIDTIKSNHGNQITLTIERGRDNPETLTIPVYVRTPDEIPQGDGALGVGISSETIEMVQYPWWQRPFRGAWYGLNSALFYGRMITVGVTQLFTGLFTQGQLPTEVAGPIGIVHTAYKENLLNQGFITILNFAALLSINLAVVNMLPIPALDGGRIFFLLIEKLLGNSFKPALEQYANGIGFALLIGLIILISIKDVGRVIGDAGINFGNTVKQVVGDP